MFNFLKKKQNSTEFTTVPEWSEFFTKNDFTKFIELIRKNFGNIHIELNAENGILVVPELLGEHHQLGLQNLASLCHNNKQKVWHHIIKEHFENIIEGHRFETELSKDIKDFSKVSKYITTRVWPKSYLDSIGEDKAIYREDIEDTVTVLTFDLPTTVRTVSPTEAQNWNVSNDELFTFGIDNVISNLVIDISEEKINNNKCYVFSGNHFFVATYALALDRFRQYIGRFGAIVGIPHRHVVIVYPINGKDVITSINDLILVASGMNKQGPGPVSPNIYWYDNGKYIKLPYQTDDNQIHFYPPDEFVNRLNEVVKE